MPDTPMVSQQRNRSIFRLLMASFGFAMFLFASGWGLYAWRYPYGWSHCCDKGISLGLVSYAHANGGCFPSGEATPEASLSLLYPKYIEAEILRGKTIRGDDAFKLLESGRRLTPETCDWHYVEGLTNRDDGRIAIFWDKVGLGHNGERLAGGGHSVGFVNGHTEIISAADWPAFLKEQKELLAARKDQ